MGCSSNTLTERSPANQVFLKMLQNFLEHLIYKKKLLQEIIMEYASFVCWCITIFCIAKTLLEKNLFQIHQRCNSNAVHIYLYFVNSLFIYANKCGYVQVICIAISRNEVHWNCEKSSQSTNWAVNAVIEFSRSVKLIQIHEIVLITGSRTAEFNQKWK